jgi:CBS domain-containing protein
MRTARDIMTTEFHTLGPGDSIAQAVKLFGEATQEEGRRVFGMMVTDTLGRLIGLLSMHDVLLFIPPKHVRLWGVMEDIDVSGLMETVCERAKSVRVEDIMTTDVITVTPDTPLMTVLDIMIKKHVRRLPVVDGEKIEGIVYISDLFHHFAERLSS